MSSGTTNCPARFSFEQRLGIFFVVQSACLSGAAVLILLSYSFVRWWKRRGLNSVDSDASGSGLFLNLMLADLLQAIGNLPSIQWIRNGFITEIPSSPGRLCVAQAVIKQIGINGVALSSLFIALHTFGVLILRWKVPRHATKIGIALIWIFIAIVVGIPNGVNRKKPYYGPTCFWCWIRTEFKAAQILSEYLWVWTSAFIMAILYGIMFLVMRGFLIIGDGIRWASKESRVRVDLSAGEDEEERAARTMANLLLFYPAVYIFCVFPNSLARWLYFSGRRNIPYQATLFANSLFAFSGLFNVILYFWTRREYAVGPSISAMAAPLPPTAQDHGHLPLHSKANQVINSREEIDVELDEHFARKPHHYSSSISSRTVPLGQGYGGPLTPRPASQFSQNETYALASPSRGSPLNPGSQFDGDDNDYGRLPG